MQVLCTRRGVWRLESLLPKKQPTMPPPLFRKKQAEPPVKTYDKDPDYDKLVPEKLKDASDTKIRCLISWADYCYWVKNTPIMHDYTFDMLVREYQKRCPDDQDFLNKLGMW